MAGGADSLWTPRIVFVCTGNTCRSPMAEGLLRKRLRGAARCEVLSAGLHAHVGAPPSPTAVRAAAEVGVDISGHRVRSMTDALAFSATFLVAMTEAHAIELRRRFPFASAKVRLIGSFADGAGEARDVPDPFGGSLDDYRSGVRLISPCVDAIAARLAAGGAI